MRRLTLFVAALAFGWCLHVTTPGVFAQSAQNAPAAQKIERIAQELQLTPRQMAEFIPILKAEGPKVEAIKSDPSLTGMQKIEQLRAVHAETDPQVRSILSPEQYQKLQEIRNQEIREAIKRKLGR